MIYKKLGERNVKQISIRIQQKQQQKIKINHDQTKYHLLIDIYYVFIKSINILQ